MADDRTKAAAETVAPACYVCGGEMLPGIALVPTIVQATNDPFGGTCYYGPGEVRPVTKCTGCGRSVYRGRMPGERAA